MRHLTPNKGDVNGGHGRRLDFRLGNIKEEGAGVWTSLRSKKSTHPNHVHKPLTAKHLRARFSEIDRICPSDIVWR